MQIKTVENGIMNGEGRKRLDLKEILNFLVVTPHGTETLLCPKQWDPVDTLSRNINVVIL